MLTIKEVRNVKVRRRPKPGKEYTKDGLPRPGRKIGKIYQTVFDPSGLRVVGFVVRRPDLLWMFKRPEQFLALDSVDFEGDSAYASHGSESWDNKAIARLGIDYETCLMWEGMDVKTQNGEELGRVNNISFDEETGQVETFFLDDGGLARSLVGSVEITRQMVVGYRKGFLVVTQEAAERKLTGGLAAKAGEATARASIQAKEGARQAGQAAGKAVDAGAYGLGRAIGRVKSSVTGARDEYRKETVPSGKKKSGSGKTTAAKTTTTKATTTASKTTKTASKTTAKAATATKAGAAKTTARKTTATAKTTTKATATKTKAPAAKGSSSKASSPAAAEKLGGHLKSAGSMFSGFKEEYDKARGKQG